MFGHRNDGINISKKLDPMVTFTPYIMPTRCESMNLVTYPAEYEPMAAFIRAHKENEYPISFVTILAAAYVRTAVRFPCMNRFVAGKRIYEHKDITLSLIVLKNTPDGSFEEAAIKVKGDKNDTIFDIARKLNTEVDLVKKVEEGNSTSDFAGFLLKLPVLPFLVVQLARLLDRLGMLPKKLLDISPFHCSLFITNMMSIGLPAIYHHLYNFGTCSIFASCGKPERQITTVGGQPMRKLMLPMGISTDERICGGAEYAKGVHMFLTYLQHPEMLELTPDEEDKKLAEKNA